MIETNNQEGCTHSRQKKDKVASPTGIPEEPLVIRVGGGNLVDGILHAVVVNGTEYYHKYNKIDILYEDIS